MSLVVLLLLLALGSRLTLGRWLVMRLLMHLRRWLMLHLLGLDRRLAMHLGLCLHGRLLHVLWLERPLPLRLSCEWRRLVLWL
jgi:hypothetical protein